MRRLTRVLALALAATLAGCSAGPGGGAAASGRDAEQVRQELQETYEATWGDPATRHAADVLTYVEHEERLATCLAARGAGHVPAPFVDGSARDPGPLSWYDPLLPVDGNGDVLVPVDQPAEEVAPSRTWPGRVATPEDVGACVQGPPEAVAVDPALDAELYQLVTEALGGSGEIQGYADCLGEDGFDAATRDELVDALLQERTPDGRPGPRERDAVVADATCRADAHRSAMAALDQPLHAFRQRHADQIAALPDRAAELRREARAAADRMGLDVTWW